MIPFSILIKGGDNYTLTYGGNPPYNYLHFRFIAEDNWLFGRTLFRVGLSTTYSIGFTVSSLTIWDFTGNQFEESSILDIVSYGSYTIGQREILFEPTAGTGSFTTGRAYWASFTLLSDVQIDIALSGTDISGKLGTASTVTNKGIFDISNTPDWSNGIEINNLWFDYTK